MVKPVSPDQVLLPSIPDEVIEIWNELIKEAWDGRRSYIKQPYAVALISNRLGITKQQAFDRHLLDIESIYEEAGWKVEYDKPGYCDDYEASFTFTKKSKSLVTPQQGNRRFSE